MTHSPTVAIVGGGPRGLSVLERMVVRAGTRPLTIDLYDASSPGSGRIWDPKQSPHLLMNTPSQEVTIFSGPPTGGSARAGAGPSLAQWVNTRPHLRSAYKGYESRATYGLYLQSALQAVVDSAPRTLRIRTIEATVTSTRKVEGRFVVTSDAGEQRWYDSVVLATGHPQPKAWHERPVHPSDATGRVIDGDSASELPLHVIESSETVATLGMGLAFHDIVALLTQGRGGSFAAGANGHLTYQPSGAEPAIIGVSRSGLPIPARGRNQKPGTFTFTPRLCTVDRMMDLRSSGQLDFTRQVEPWILAEAAITFCLTQITNGPNPSAAPDFLREVERDTGDPSAVEMVYSIAKCYGVSERLPSLASLARPFRGSSFQSTAHWTSTLKTYLETDLARAHRGNVTDPVKAALDTLRDLRPSIRAAVDFGGLTPTSHEDDFLARFVPEYSLLVAGPPVDRNAEMLALIEAGIVTIAGPGATIRENEQGLLHVHAPSVPGVHLVDRVVDARIPRYEVGRCRSVLYPQLLADGLIRRFRHTGDTISVETGACETDPGTARAIGHDGRPTEGLFLIGIPTERLRWFTQIGNGRPEVFGGFTAEADLVAAQCLQHLQPDIRSDLTLSGAQR